LFDELHAQGITIVLVTHEDDVATRAQTVIHFRDGKVERVAQNRMNPGLKTPSPH
jgi:putative ABC transport system ATP-binding protein